MICIPVPTAYLKQAPANVFMPPFRTIKGVIVYVLSDLTHDGELRKGIIKSAESQAQYVFNGFHSDGQFCGASQPPESHNKKL